MNGTPEAKGPFVAIPREVIAADAVTGVHLYLRVGDRFVLYRSGDEPIDAESLQKLQRRSIEVIYVQASQHDRMGRYIVDHLDALIASAETPQVQGTVLRETTRTLLRASLHRLDDPAIYDRVRGTADRSVECITGDSAVVPSLVRFADADERVLTHSVNVAAYAVALAARHPRLSDLDVYSIGVGALVHDAGLARIDASLLAAKPGDLNEMERDYLAQHPARGLTMLQQAGVTDPIVRDVVRNHHPRPGGPEPSLHAQIVQLADAFDSLTSRPLDGRRQGPFAALYHMRHRESGGYSSQLIREFVLLLGTMAVGDLDSPVAPLSRRLSAA